MSSLGSAPRRVRHRFGFVLAAGALLVGGCAADPAPPGGGTTGDAGDGDAGMSDGGTLDIGSDLGGFDVSLGDAGDDAGVDSGSDATSDGGPDATIDAAPDVPVGDPVCGNGRLEAGEICDDGNNFPGDGCDPTCSSDESCGNGFLDRGEQCDDGNLISGDGCDRTCANEVGCGNGIVERGEQCDDGNVEDGDGCSRSCQREVFVATDTDGDGIADFDEGNGAVDTDGDGVTDDLDDDSDGDGLPDADEAGDTDLGTPPRDTDRDGTPDFRDLDSDGDGISDTDEGLVDTDGDGLANAFDADSDADYVPDAQEGVVDSDGDGTPDYLDVDSDGDTILDEHELFADSDRDGTPNRLDLDSDGDGRPDAAEAGDADPETYPVDFDSDGQPDYIDRDSDGDGLTDGTELGCGAGSSDALDADTDDDGFDDLAEYLVGSDPCATTSADEFEDFTDFFFVLPEGGPEQDEPLEFASNIVQADVALNMDTTGSMRDEINNLRSTVSGTVVPQIRAGTPDTAFSVSRFDDFPCGSRGDSGDVPFQLMQRVTRDVAAVQTAVDALRAAGGNDTPESGFQALYQIATGAALNACEASVPAFDPAAGLVPDVADGTIGGVGFRDGSFPIIIHMTDAPSHDADAYSGAVASRADAIAALAAIQARVIGVASGSNPRSQLEALAVDTGAIVPTCAWDGVRPGGCGGSQCCTGIGGDGRGPVDGVCPLVFDISGDGTGLGTTVVTAVRALVNTTTLDVTTRVVRDEEEFLASGIDTSCFITGIVPNSATPPSTSCTTIPEIVDLYPPAGVPDSFTGVTPGTALFFDVFAQNDVCVEALDVPQAFAATIEVVGDGLTVLDTQTVTIIVPAVDSNPSTVP